MRLSLRGTAGNLLDRRERRANAGPTRFAKALALALMLSFGAACSHASATPGAALEADLHDEAGFLDVPPQAHGSPHSGRMFYVFEVADEDPAHKPLAVFLAGGPGFPSSLDLLPYGMARRTIDPSAPPGAPPIPNPASWTSFANVLFIDERQAGFSYETGEGEPSGTDAGSCSFSAIDDAADVAHALLGFLDAHGKLRAAPVIFVGQSYSGTRASLAVDLLLRYSTEASRVDASLLGEIQAHYDRVFPEHAGTIVDPALAATQFGREVLLQPLVRGGAQYAAQDRLEPSDPYVGTVPSGKDPYDVRQPQGWSRGLDENAATAFADIASATQLFALDPRAISRLGPADRSAAFRVAVPETPGTALANAALTSVLGALGPNDRYLAYPSTACFYDDTLFAGVGSAEEFVANLKGGVRTFISHARYDSVIYSPAIPAELQEVGTVVVDISPRPGVARPGWFTVSFPADGGMTSPIEVRFPPYEDSGHFIGVAEPQHLHDDVADWLVTGP